MRELKNAIEQMPHVEEAHFKGGFRRHFLFVTLKMPPANFSQVAERYGFTEHIVKNSFPALGSALESEVATISIEAPGGPQRLEKTRVTILAKTRNLSPETRQTLQRLVSDLQ